MGIQESLEQLKRAQEVDQEIYRIRRELESIPEADRQLDALFEAEKAEMARLETEVKQTQLRQKQKEGELGEKEALIRKYDSQLAQVKTNKEYATLQQEIASIKADNSILEDSILGILEEVDKIQRQVREERERLAQVEKEWQQKKKELVVQGETLKASLVTLNQKRQEIVAQVPPEVRELYDKIIERKEGIALVPVEGESCGGCRMELRPQLLNDVKLKEALVFCESCSRILYTD